MSVRQKAGVTWCSEHQRYETLFEDESRASDNPHLPDDNPEGPIPDHRAYVEPHGVEKAVHREWLQ